MKKTDTTKTIAIDFSKLSGHAREYLSIAIQTALFKLGYRWGQTGITPEFTTMLRVYVTDGKISLTYTDSPFIPDGNFVVFDAATECETFLRVAKTYWAVKRTIEGVVVTITSDSINLDTTDLQTRVAAQAKKIQSEIFEQ